MYTGRSLISLVITVLCSNVYCTYIYGICCFILHFMFISVRFYFCLLVGEFFNRILYLGVLSMVLNLIMGIQLNPYKLIRTNFGKNQTDLELAYRKNGRTQTKAVNLNNQNFVMYEGRSKSFVTQYDAQMIQAKFLCYYST